MEPIFFREEKDKLYGVFHECKGNDLNSGVIICNPFGHEYMRAHRTLFTLAENLSDLGFDVLRFDFLGCGDSSGELDQVSVENWIGDIKSAIDLLRNSKQYSTIYIVGNRLGATLAIQAASLFKNITALVLWDPVTNGADYIKYLSNVHDEWLIQSFSSKNKSKLENEFIGFEINKKLLSGIANINLIDLKELNIDKLLYIQTTPKVENIDFQTLLKKQVTDYLFLHLPGNYGWKKQKDDDNNYVIPVEVIAHITNWIQKISAE